MAVPLALSMALERGALAAAPLPGLRALERAWALASGRGVVRRLRWPEGVRVVAVGGATLGGSGKTPLAIACAAELASRGARVALVGHAYRASPGRARLVDRGDRLSEVGDEALVAARQLAGMARVVVAPSRAAAIALAAQVADVLVLDGVAQTTPVRAALALLAVDAAEPWGHARALPPRGDLRAPVRSLLDAADRVVALGDELDGASAPPEGAAHVRVGSPGVRVGEELLAWDAVRPLRVGLVCALARPERILVALARRGVEPVAVIRGPDHGPIRWPGRARTRAGAAVDAPFDAGVDLWLATPKCALHARGLPFSAPIGVLEQSLSLPGSLRDALTAAAMGHTLQTSRND
jgi:tetraacyldisaccharide 4'-kinase